MTEFVPYTDRANELLKKINDITDDYSDAEIVLALGRRLLFMSFGPMQPPALEVERMWALTEGFQTMLQYRSLGISHTLGLVLVGGMLSALAASEVSSQGILA